MDAPTVHNQQMNDHRNWRVIQVSRFRDDVIITFADGRAAIYSAALLFAMFPNADELFEEEDSHDQNR